MNQPTPARADVPQSAAEAPAPEVALTTRALAARNNDRQKGVRAALAHALTPATESLAFAYTEALLAPMENRQAKTAARRVAGIICTHKHTPAYRRPEGGNPRPLGKALRMLHKATQGYDAGDLADGAFRRNQMTMQIDSLPLLPLEEAVQVIALLVGRCGHAGIAVDFYDMARTLTRWGNGITPASRNVRNRVVEQFYGARR